MDEFNKETNNLNNNQFGDPINSDFGTISQEVPQAVESEEAGTTQTEAAIGSKDAEMDAELQQQQTQPQQTQQQYTQPQQTVRFSEPQQPKNQPYYTENVKKIKKCIKIFLILS